MPPFRPQLSDMLKAARLGDVAEVQAQMQAGMKPGACGMDGQTALHEAALWNRLEVAKLLLDANADPNVDANVTHRPLRLAAKRGQPEMVQLLVDYGANPTGKSVVTGTSIKTDTPVNDAGRACVKILQAAEAAWAAKHAHAQAA